MALNGTQMGNAVADVVLAMGGSPLSSAEQQTVRDFWQAICTAMVDHITTNGHALPGTFLDSLGSPITGQGDIQ
jgi:hydroxyethylthiazole kinase-like sugar kinase family protein